MLSGETVVVLTAGTTTDPYSGEDRPDWDAASEVAVPDVMVGDFPSDEPTQAARNQVNSGVTLYFQTVPDMAITSAHRVRVRGVDYDVLGEPVDWRMGSTVYGLVVECARSVG